MPFVGELVADKYRLERKLGAGGGGVVFAAEHVDLQNRVAIKFLEATFDPTSRKRFVREARACVKLQSEHVARVLDVGDEGSQPYIVMEFLEGTDLRVYTYEHGAPVALADACEFVIHACHGLAEAHSRGIVHRDMKPGNLFLTHDAHGLPIVKVLDFGISKVDPEQSRSMADTKMLGTPQYMAPEQIESATNVDHRADIWGLGVTLYELLARARPFEAPALMDLIAAIAIATPPRIDHVRKDLPEGIAGVIERCLSKKPSGRFGSCAELAKALQPFAPSRARVVVDKVALLPVPLVPAPPPSSDAIGPVRVTPLVFEDDDFDADDYATTHGQSRAPISLLPRQKEEQAKKNGARARGAAPAPPPTTTGPTAPSLPSLSADDTTTAMVKPVELVDDTTVAQARPVKRSLLDDAAPEAELFIETVPMPKPDPRPPPPLVAPQPVALAPATMQPSRSAGSRVAPTVLVPTTESSSAASASSSRLAAIGIAIALVVAAIAFWRVSRSAAATAEDDTSSSRATTASSSAAPEPPTPPPTATPLILAFPTSSTATPPPIDSVKPRTSTPRRPPPPPAPPTTATAPPRSSSRAPSLSEYPPTRE